MKLFSSITVFIQGLFWTGFTVLADTTNTSTGNNPTTTVATQPGVDLTVQSLYNILQGLACWASKFILIIMIGMIIWYGFRMMTAGSNENRFKESRKGITYAIIGIVVILGAYTIIATVGNAIQSIGTSQTTSWVNYTPLGSCSGTVASTSTLTPTTSSGIQSFGSSCPPDESGSLDANGNLVCK